MSVTGLFGMTNLKGLVPDLLFPEEAFAGMAAPFRLRIRNTKRYIPSFLITVECGGQRMTIPLVPRSGTATGTIALTFPTRGRAAVGQLTVSSPFPVNFFIRYWIFPVNRNMIVFPHLLQGPAAGDGRGKRQSGNNTRHERGLDGELERISTYSGLEPLKMIHWKLSARSDDLLVKEFGRHAAAPLLIDLAVLPGQNREERISRAAWLVRHWVRDRPVGLKLDNRTIPAEAGHRHGLRLLSELALYGID